MTQEDRERENRIRETQRQNARKGIGSPEQRDLAERLRQAQRETRDMENGKPARRTSWQPLGNDGHAHG